jgi:hypothetical protein
MHNCHSEIYVGLMGLGEKSASLLLIRMRENAQISRKLINRSIMARGSLDLNQSGGYDYDFVNEVPDRLTCQICAKPFRDPHLVVCCGKHYCGSCLTTSFRKMSVESCPHCRAEGDRLKYVDHKGLKSEVCELDIYFPSAMKAANG